MCYTPKECNLILPSEPEISKVVPVFISETYSIVSRMTLFGMCPIIWLVLYNYCKLAAAILVITLSNLSLTATYAPDILSETRPRPFYVHIVVFHVLKMAICLRIKPDIAH
jgi:hypothetical protein